MPTVINRMRQTTQKAGLRDRWQTTRGECKQAALGASTYTAVIAERIKEIKGLAYFRASDRYPTADLMPRVQPS